MVIIAFNIIEDISRPTCVYMGTLANSRSTFQFIGLFQLPIWAVVTGILSQRGTLRSTTLYFVLKIIRLTATTRKLMMRKR